MTELTWTSIRVPGLGTVELLHETVGLHFRLLALKPDQSLWISDLDLTLQLFVLR